MLWIKIKYRLTFWCHNFLIRLGIGNWLLKNRYGERILVFHGIDSIGETKYNSRFISKAYFEDLIIHLSNNYNIISLDDYYLKKFKPDTLNIAITFDDGYLNNYLYAVPILSKYNIPASFYITTVHSQQSFLWPDFLDLVTFYTKKKEITFNQNLYTKNNKNEFMHRGNSLKYDCKTLPFSIVRTLFEIFDEEWKIVKSQNLHEYWELMNTSQIKEISKNPLFTIGSHGVTHVNLNEMDSKIANKEINESQNILQHICGIPINQFAFPFGYYSDELIDYCKQVGYEKILLVDYNNHNDKKDPKLKNRFVINPYISKEYQLVCLLKGSYF